MADIKGDKSKQPPECESVFTPYTPEEIAAKPWLLGSGNWSKCPNIKDGYSDFELERYHCDVCGESYTLYYV